MSDSKKSLADVVCSSNPADIANYVCEFENGITVYMQSKCDDLDIASLKRTLVSFFHDTSGNTVVANSEAIMMDGRHFSSLGYASTQQFQTDNVELLSCLAAADSLYKVISFAESFPDPDLNVPEVPVRRSTKK